MIWTNAAIALTTNTNVNECGDEADNGVGDGSFVIAASSAQVAPSPRPLMSSFRPHRLAKVTHTGATIVITHKGALISGCSGGCGSGSAEQTLGGNSDDSVGDSGADDNGDVDGGGGGSGDGDRGNGSDGGGGNDG